MIEGGHWLLHRGKTIRRRLGAGTIVQRAHALVHEGGATALSMRALASSLETSTSELYRLVPSKQWLLVAIVDHVLAEVETAPTQERRVPARARLEALSASYRDVLAVHPHLHEILTSHVALTPNTMRIAEAALTCLRDHGIWDEELIDAYNTWCGYVIGFSIIETQPSDHSPGPQLQEAMRAQLERADPDEFPTLAQLMDASANRAYGLRWQGDRLGNGRTSFEWGLTALLDAYERRGARERRSKRRQGTGSTSS